MRIHIWLSVYTDHRISETNPALLVADHVDKVRSIRSLVPAMRRADTDYWQVLYIIPVPLDAATIGDATICCPLVIKRDGDSLICSILPKATTDRNMIAAATDWSARASRKRSSVPTSMFQLLIQLLRKVMLPFPT